MRTFAGGWVMQGVLPASEVSPRILLIDDERRILDFVARGLRGVLRRKPSQPVIILSALGDPVTKVRCLELGAQDSLAKPFSLDELIARVRARLRQATEPPAARVTAGRLTLDLIRRQADAG